MGHIDASEQSRLNAIETFVVADLHFLSVDDYDCHRRSIYDLGFKICLAELVNADYF